MSARSFLIRGLLAGLLAGFLAFAVAHQVGEPQVERAIALEEAGAATAPADSQSGTETHADGTTHSHSAGESGGTEVSRTNQRTWGLLTGSLGVGIALGGLVALVSAALVGRLGALSPGQSTAVVSLIGFVSVAMVPFWKYPANPPAVGSAETIGDRTASYFAFLLISVAVAVATTALAVKIREMQGTYVGVLAGAGLYLVVMIVAGQLLPTVNELGDFPADTLWYFRRASLFTLATMWAVIGIALTGMIGRLHRQAQHDVARRELAASL